MGYFFKPSKREISTVPIFVIGTGRSGTHLLGRTFQSNPETKVMIEKPKFFKAITALATGKNKRKSDLKKIIIQYEKEFAKTKERYILEKTHPNIWYVAELLKAFPNAKFLGIKRNVYATVSSMLNHKMVMNWYEVLPDDEINPFLGITSDNIDSYKYLPIESKCALRWSSHTERLIQLEKDFPKSVLILDYEDFFFNYNELLSKLKDFIGMETTLNSEILKKESLDKWKNFLTKEQIANINSVIKK